MVTSVSYTFIFAMQILMLWLLNPLQIYKLSKTKPVCPLRNFSFYHDKLFEDVQ